MVVLILVGCGIAAAVVTIWASPSRSLRGAASSVLALCLLGVGMLAFSSFEDRKLVASLLMPTGLLWLALFARILMDLFRLQLVAGLLSALLFFAYTLAGNVPFTTDLVRALEAELPEYVPPEVPFEAALVLGGGTNLTPEGEPELAAGGDRLRVAAALLHHGHTERLVTSGFSPPPYGLGDMTEDTVELWTDMGVETSSTTCVVTSSTALDGCRILRLGWPTNTAEELDALRALTERAGWTRVAVISSAWHLPRALQLAQSKGLELTPVPADFRVGLESPSTPFWWVPRPGGFELSRIWAWEHLGRIVGD